MTKSAGTMIALAGLVLGLSACQGDTDPSTPIQATQAHLNAHGRTDDGPATWWWEHSDTLKLLLGGSGIEVCGSPREPDGRLWSRLSPSEVKLSALVKGLLRTGPTPSGRAGRTSTTPLRAAA